MTLTADEYNLYRFNGSTLSRIDVFTELVRIAQEKLGLEVDGKFGPVTEAAIRARIAAREHIRAAAAVAPAGPRVWNLDDPITISDDGWMSGAGVLVYRRLDGRPGIHPSWYSGRMVRDPAAIVAHYTDTDPGTALNMAHARSLPFNVASDRDASWQVTIESADVEWPIVQMAPLNARCWHAGGDGALPIEGLGSANGVAVGIELVGRGDVFPALQILHAKRVWRAIVSRYKIDPRHAMIEHSAINPRHRRDPGPVWMSTDGPAAQVLRYAYT